MLALAAQGADVQVPLDSGGNIRVLTRDLEDKLRLFPDHPGFREARAFRLPDGAISVEITSESGGETLRERIPLGATAFAEFQARVTALAGERAPGSALDQKGRTRLVTGIRVLSAAYYGWAIPLAFNVQNGGTAGGLYLVTAGTGFFLPLVLTKNAQVTEGQAELAMYGGLMGINHAFLLHTAITGWKDLHPRTAVAESLVFSLGELYGFYRWAGKTGISGGSARTMSVCSGWGEGMALGAAYLAGADEDSARAFGITGLLGSAGGFWGGRYLASRQSYSLGDASVLGTTAGLGTYIPVAFMLAGAVDEPKAYAAAAMAGCALGIGTGHLLTAGRDLTEGQAFLVGLGVASGNLVGFGLSYLARPNDYTPRMFFLSSAFGSVGGFALAWWWASDDPQAKAPPGNVRFNVAPANAFAPRPLPILSVQADF